MVHENFLQSIDLQEGTENPETVTFSSCNDPEPFEKKDMFLNEDSTDLAEDENEGLERVAISRFNEEVSLQPKGVVVSEYSTDIALEEIEETEREEIKTFNKQVPFKTKTVYQKEDLNVIFKDLKETPEQQKKVATSRSKKQVPFKPKAIIFKEYSNDIGKEHKIEMDSANWREANGESENIPVGFVKNEKPTMVKVDEECPTDALKKLIASEKQTWRLKMNAASCIMQKGAEKSKVLLKKARAKPFLSLLAVLMSLPILMVLFWLLVFCSLLLIFMSFLMGSIVFLLVPVIISTGIFCCFAAAVGSITTCSILSGFNALIAFTKRLDMFLSERRKK